MPPLPGEPNVDSFFNNYTNQDTGTGSQQMVARMMALYGLTMFRSLTPQEQSELQGLVATLRPQGLVPPNVAAVVAPPAVVEEKVELKEPSFAPAELRTAVTQKLITQDEANQIAAGAPPTSVIGRERVNQVAAATLWDAPGQQITPPEFEKGEINSAGWAELVKENRETAEVYYRWLLSQGISPADAVREMAIEEVIYNPNDGTGVAYHAGSGDAIGLVSYDDALSPAGVGGGVNTGGGAGGAADPYAGMTEEQRNAAIYDEQVSRANAAVDQYAADLGVRLFKGDVPGTGFYYDDMGRQVPIAYIDSRGRVEAGTPQTSNRVVQGPGGFSAITNAPRAMAIDQASREAGAPKLSPAQAAVVSNLGQTAGAKYAQEALGLPYVPTLSELVALMGGGSVAGFAADSLPWARSVGGEALTDIASGTGRDPEFEARTRAWAERVFPGDPYAQEAWVSSRIAGHRITDAYNEFQNPLPIAGLGSEAVKYAENSGYSYDEEKGNWVSGNATIYNPETGNWDAQRISTQQLSGEQQGSQVDPAAMAQMMANALDQAAGLGYQIVASPNGWAIQNPDGSMMPGGASREQAEAALARYIYQQLQREREQTPFYDTGRPWHSYGAPPTPVITPGTESGSPRPRPPSGPTHPDLPPPTDTGPTPPTPPTPPQAQLPEPYPLPVFAFASGGNVTAGPPKIYEDWPVYLPEDWTDFFRKFGTLFPQLLQGGVIQGARQPIAPTPGLFRPDVKLNPSQVKDSRMWSYPPVAGFAEGGTMSVNPAGQPNVMLNEPAVIQGTQSGRVYGVAGEAGTQEQVQFNPTPVPQNPSAVPPPQGQVPAPMVPMGAPKASNPRSVQQAQSLLKVAKTSNVPLPELEAAVSEGRWKEAARMLEVPMSQVLRTAAKV